MVDRNFAGRQASPFEPFRPLRRKTAVLMTALAFVGQAAWASNRFEIVDGNLLDLSTGLLWQQTSATTLNAFPVDSSLANGWRIATGNEVLNLFSDIDFASETTISQASDAFTALSFFASSSSTAPFCGSFSAGGTCISGFASDDPAPSSAGYDIVAYDYRIGKAGSVIVDSTGSLGDYTQGSCGGFCGPQTYFTVQSVPEPAGGVLATLGMALALLGAGIRSRKDTQL